jgi:hypothetical protein
MAKQKPVTTGQEAAAEVIKTKRISAKEAHRILKEEQQAQLDACQKEVEAVLERYNCTLDLSMVINHRGAAPILRYVMRPPKTEPKNAKTG